MSERANEKNIKALAEMAIAARDGLKKAEERIMRLENNMVSLQAELGNTKQLYAHLLGRGNGPTT